MNQDSTQPSQTVLFCQQCNQRYAVAEEDPVCPNCGLDLVSLAEAPTADFGKSGLSSLAPPDTSFIPTGSDDLIGRHLAHYQVESYLGRGGMARVYLARHLTLERPCAVKVLSPQLLKRNPESLNRFFAEARAAAALIHPNVVTVHSLAHDDGLHLIEMEYVDGQSLQALAKRKRRLDLIEATAIMVQICSALELAHKLGIIHRDIKPANVMMTSSGIAKLADFGLAKRVVSTSGRTPHPESLAGTPAYMAPELFDGAPADMRSDVYAMGVTLYVLLTGLTPFHQNSLTELARLHAEQPVPDLRRIIAHVPDHLEEVIRRCMSKEPRERFADSTELLHELRMVYGNLRPLSSIVDEAIAGLNVTVTRENDAFLLRMELAEGRFQTVRVAESASGPLADRLVKIYSVCGFAVPEYYRRALELNATLTHGAVAIENINGSPHFVMNNAYSRATCDPSEIRGSLLTIAHHADAIEKLLSDEDRH
ncbi:MAG: protein kinase [Pirellulaceae bacterium]|nr:protein kinase [Planctomycetales bacterium]